MTLPTERDEQLYADRPGDEVFTQVKHHFPNILERSSLLKEGLIQIMIDDLVLDHALSNALDEIGAILEYQAQSEGIEKPKFNGLSILKDAERVGKLKFILNLCGVLGLDEETTEAIRDAEVDRIWGSDVAKSKRDGGGVGNTLRLSDDVTGILKDLTRVLGKKEHTHVNKSSGSVDQLARTIRERAKSNSATFK
jgi:hypothetical protein